ncbi:hypothetical protein [Methylobacterium brachiatum]|uniref:hypothetical protein n=1 Tax=Methylobacterium brachiatum TaxID=269660 RepID=UPI000EFBDB0F|nr:hypothetical protein [Methylobacterium brachiatum]AYO80912.1 hypothetical protein EBB05_00430 [Methylobacterium brachiatum]
MTEPSWISLARHRPVFDLPRDDLGGRSDAGLRHRQEDGLKEANDLQASDAVALVRTIRAKTLRQPLPDSTPMIRADRDGR